MKIFLVLVAMMLVVANAQVCKLKACWRQAESRGSGVLPDRITRRCPPYKPEKFGHLCYRTCKHARVGDGPLCWDDCHATEYEAMRLVFCCKTPEICAQLEELVSRNYPDALAKLALDITLNPTNIAQILKDFERVVEDQEKMHLPYCSHIPPPLPLEEETS